MGPEQRLSQENVKNATVGTYPSETQPNPHAPQKDLVRRRLFPTRFSDRLSCRRRDHANRRRLFNDARLDRGDLLPVYLAMPKMQQGL